MQSQTAFGSKPSFARKQVNRRHRPAVLECLKHFLGVVFDCHRINFHRQLCLAKGSTLKKPGSLIFAGNVKLPEVVREVRGTLAADTGLCSP